MAEVIIPTDKLPPYILRHLQAIVDGSLMVSSSRGTSLPQAPAPSHLQTSTSTAMSWSTCAISSAVNSSSTASFVNSLSQSPQYCKGLPVATSPRLKMASSASPLSMFSSTALAYNPQTNMSRKCESSIPTIVSATCDEIDGGPHDPVIQLSGTSPRKKKKTIMDAMDNSGIVRVFPVADDDSSMEDEATRFQNDSEIVRIFPEIDQVKTLAQEPSIIRTFAPTSSHNPIITPRPETVNVFGNNRQSSASSGQEWNSKPTTEVLPQSGIVSSSQGSILQAQAPRRALSVTRPLHGSCDMTNSHSSMPKKVKSNANFNITISPISSPGRCDVQHTSSRHQTTEQDVHLNKHLTPPFSHNIRRSPGLPTPPQTPDNGDDDIEDDVFTYNAPGHENVLQRPQSYQPIRKNSDSTPRRSFAHLRHNSDRSSELRSPMAHNSSPFGVSAQTVTDQSFGDRHKTRKRLSFDDQMINKPPPPWSLHYSDPTLVPPTMQALHRTTSNNSSTSSASSSRSCQTGQCQLPNPTPLYHSPPFTFQNEPTNGERQPISAFHQSNHNQAPPLSSPTSKKSHVQDVFTMIEKVVHQQTLLPILNSKQYPEGDCLPDDLSRGESSRDRTPPPLDLYQPRPRGQSFSHSKRQRRDFDDDSDQPQESLSANQPQMSWANDQSSVTGGDCTCASIARNFLQFVESAYRSVGQMDGTQAGLDRFRQELARTNHILQESLAIVQNMRELCQHDVRSQSDPSGAINLR